ncbi:MAG TPA: 50S ribosomal protein L32 [Candidatus Methylacidiphilales bacterium]
MGTPKRKTSKARMRTRKAANKWTAPGLFTDKKTGNRHLPHTVDPKSGTYRGRQVLAVEE